jgi:hypothetical protein
VAGLAGEPFDEAHHVLLPGDRARGHAWVIVDTKPARLQAHRNPGVDVSVRRQQFVPSSVVRRVGHDDDVGVGCQRAGLARESGAAARAVSGAWATENLDAGGAGLLLGVPASAAALDQDP